MKKMPVLFLGHGSPMNIVEVNEYTLMLKKLGQKYSSTQAILAISAHWQTKGVWLTAMARPETIHDFTGFPTELYEKSYPAPGNPHLAREIKNRLSDLKINLDEDKWGLDHGAWAVLYHMFPSASIPVIQLSLDMTRPMNFHYELGRKLQFLRENGVLIIGSGNIVHNLREIVWERDANPTIWCKEFDEWVKANLEKKNFDPLIFDALKSSAGKKSIPTTEHYLPLLYILGASDAEDNLAFEYEGYQNASISMRCVSFTS